MSINKFAEHLRKLNLRLERKQIKTVQLNLGKKCNLACNHCHVDAGPLREEMMDEKTADRVIELLKVSPTVSVVDLTGGAPELNSNFRKLVKVARSLEKEVIIRCNITVLFENGQADTANFFAENQVQVVASLPCYSKSNVEKQRGRGVFDKSIEGLKLLNNLGYGIEGTGLILDLVYNPGGAFLPPNQLKLENDYKKELKNLFNIDFNHLYTITNMPIKRFKTDLIREHKLDDYMNLLMDNFNEKALNEVMCKTLISISYDGYLYDCDFNQMLEMNIQNNPEKDKASIWEVDTFDQFLLNKKVLTQDHCFACTAGAGSSCGGALN